ncbi:MAG: DUF5110 domain-containing protein [Bacteroidetes bacterium]|nr:DUF5110 domain-containing protein [Bacteroidota bacterium]
MKPIRIIFMACTLWLCMVSGLQAQIVRLDPVSPSINDSVTVFFNAAEGNKALMGYTGDVYLHTGVITSKSLDGHDWKYVVGDWGKDDKRVKMKRIGKDLYTLNLVIKSFYGLRPEDKANQLSFVFRNTDGTLVGKTGENEDVLVPVDGYKPPIREVAGENRQWQKLLNIEQDNLNRYWKIKTDKGTVFVMPYADNIIRAWFLPSGETRDDSSHAVILKPDIVPMKIEETSQGTRMSAGKMTILAHHDPFFLTYIFNGDTLLKEECGLYHRTGNSGVRFRLPAGEKIYGTGERAIPMDRKGFILPLYNRPFYGYETGATMLNYSLPLTLSSKKYAVLFDNPQKGVIDIGKTEAEVLEWNAIGGPARYFVVADVSLADLMKSYTRLTGRQPLPPRWAFGNLQSRMAYRNQKETDSIVTLMQKKNFPIDAIILDFYWFGDSILGHLGRLDWYKPAWPDPEGMIRNFRKKGVKTILITEPYIIDSVPNFNIAAAKKILATDSLGNAYVNHQFYFGPGGLIDIFKPQACDWFWEKYQAQIKKGVAGWWGDLGEPESHPADLYHVNGKADEVHNIYGHYWDRMLFEKYASLYPKTRLFHLQRSGFAGSQRYSAFPWTGDVSRSWGGYRAQLPLLLTMSICGLGYIHSDAGGFAQGVKDEELYIRWLQFAVFTPIFRPHGSGIPSEPVFFSEKTQDIVRNAMNLRYRFLPYNYTLAWQNSTTGSPLMRPLFYYHPDDKEAVSCQDEYYWGENILVAPVLDKGATTRKVYFPEGNWFDFYTDRQYPGKTTAEVPLTLENMPLFCKAGSIIPLTRPLSSTDNYHSDNFTVRIYPSGNCSFNQYEDDGWNNLAARDNKYELIRYEASLQREGIRININKKGQWEGMPGQRDVMLEVWNTGKVKEITLNGIPVSSGKTETVTIMDSTFYYISGNWTKIHFPWDGKPVKIEIIN